MASNDDGITLPAKRESGLSEFIRTTRIEIAKVTWPERKETLRMTITIVVMALIAGIFFFGVDWVLGFAVSHLLGMNAQ